MPYIEVDTLIEGKKRLHSYLDISKCVEITSIRDPISKDSNEEPLETSSEISSKNLGDNVFSYLDHSGFRKLKKYIALPFTLDEYNVNVYYFIRKISENYTNHLQLVLYIKKIKHSTTYNDLVRCNCCFTLNSKGNMTYNLEVELPKDTGKRFLEAYELVFLSTTFNEDNIWNLVKCLEDIIKSRKRNSYIVSGRLTGISKIMISIFKIIDENILHIKNEYYFNNFIGIVSVLYKKIEIEGIVIDETYRKVK